MMEVEGQMQLFFSSPVDSCSLHQLALGFCAALSRWRDNGWEEEQEEDEGEEEEQEEDEGEAETRRK